VNKHVTPDEISRNGDSGAFRVVKPQNQTYALGLSIEVTARHDAYGGIPFAEWVQILVGQIARNHYFFVIDGSGNVVGYAGWAVADRDEAVAWLEKGKALPHDRCREGDCVILNAWVADNAAVRNFMIEHAGAELDGQKMLFAKRVYPDGKVRAVKLPVDELHRAVAKS